MRFLLSVFSVLILLVATQAMDIQCPASEALKVAMKRFCEESTFDAVYRVGNTNDYYIFKGEMVILRLSNGVIPAGYPMHINKLWPSSPSNVDAMFSYSTNGKFYILKDNQYWRYSFVNSTYLLDDGFPSSISEGFNGVPNKVDAAVEWGKYIYFFKANMYYRYDPCNNETYNVPMTDFKEIPININAVARSIDGGTAYFWKGEVYYGYTLSTNTFGGYFYMNSRWLNCKW